MFGTDASDCSTPGEALRKIVRSVRSRASPPEFAADEATGLSFLDEDPDNQATGLHLLTTDEAYRRRPSRRIIDGWYRD
jgi:hypothetical protein